MSKKDEELRNKKRALTYAISLVVFQEVGAGPNETYELVLEVVNTIKHICKKETGIELESYPTEFIEENEKLVKKMRVPYCIFKMFEKVKK